MGKRDRVSDVFGKEIGEVWEDGERWWFKHDADADILGGGHGTTLPTDHLGGPFNTRDDAIAELSQRASAVA